MHIDREITARPELIQIENGWRNGLLHHESDLRIEEHYTDTAGATDHVFGLCHLLGYRFAPRIKDLKDRKLYTIEKPGTYPVLEPLIGAVQGQIVLLVFIILFIQRRPRGLFALRGRAVEA